MRECEGWHVSGWLLTRDKDGVAGDIVHHRGVAEEFAVKSWRPNLDGDVFEIIVA